MKKLLRQAWQSGRAKATRSARRKVSEGRHTRPFVDKELQGLRLGGSGMLVLHTK